MRLGGGRVTTACRPLPSPRRAPGEAVGAAAASCPAAEVERWSSLKVWLFSLFNRTPKSNLAAVERISLTASDRFLDLGCGLGAALEHAAATGAYVAGVDPSPAMAERAAQRVPRPP